MVVNLSSPIKRLKSQLYIDKIAQYSSKTSYITRAVNYLDLNALIKALI